MRNHNLNKPQNNTIDAICIHISCLDNYCWHLVCAYSQSKQQLAILNHSQFVSYRKLHRGDIRKFSYVGIQTLIVSRIGKERSQVFGSWKYEGGDAINLSDGKVRCKLGTELFLERVCQSVRKVMLYDFLKLANSISLTWPSHPRSCIPVSRRCRYASPQLAQPVFRDEQIDERILPSSTLPFFLLRQLLSIHH